MSFDSNLYAVHVFLTDAVIMLMNTVHKNVKRRLRNTGEKYLSKSGKTVAMCKWQPSQCLERKCPLKCHTRVSESCQSELFNYY